jgi:poly-gamma-glutamate capsule biosynthesis protein CapA/YwtB (metallophosphatase superfamily)
MAEGDAAGERPTRIGFVGDIVLARRITAAFRRGQAPEAFWGTVRPELLSLDAVIGNLEGALSATRLRYGHGFKAFHFCADPRTVAILAAGNIRAVSLANNHILDGRVEGLSDTLRHLDGAGIAHAGAGADLGAALKPVTFRVGTSTIGLAAITNTIPPFAAKPNRPGTAFVPIRPNPITALLLSQLAAELSRQGADFRILSIHWGPNFRPAPPARYREFARMAIDAGFDIVHGHSAHVVQAVEYHRAGIILYDTGDFLDDFYVLPGMRSDRTFLFEVGLLPGQQPTLRLVPVSLKRYAANLAEGREAETIRQAMVGRCRGYNVRFTPADGALIAQPLAGHDAATGPAVRSTASARSTT